MGEEQQNPEKLDCEEEIVDLGFLRAECAKEGNHALALAIDAIRNRIGKKSRGIYERLTHRHSAFSSVSVCVDSSQADGKEQLMPETDCVARLRQLYRAWKCYSCVNSRKDKQDVYLRCADPARVEQAKPGRRLWIHTLEECTFWEL